MPDYDKWTEKEQEAFAERIDYPVRKAAHATEYACFAVLLMGMYQSYGLAGRRQIIASFLSAAAYAATDEFHQLFCAGQRMQSYRCADRQSWGGGRYIALSCSEFSACPAGALQERSRKCSIGNRKNHII